MDITWYGLSCFRFMERGQAAIVADPYQAAVLGLKDDDMPRIRGEIVTISHDAPGHNAVESVTGGTYILERPGEYEIGGVFITGIATYNPALPPEGLRKNIIFLYDFDKYTVCHLGDLDHIPSQSQIEGMGQVDVLLIPVGGGRALNAAQAGEVISRIEPSIVVPMHYETPGGKLGLESVDQFLKEMGVTQVEEQDYLRVNTSTLAEETQIILLTPQK